MNKHRLGVSHRRGGLFYRLYFITVCHLHRGMLIASCDYLHIWKSTSICHVPPFSHESVLPFPTNNCCLFTRWQAAPKPGDTCTLHPAVWHMWTSHTHVHTHTHADAHTLKHLTLSCHTPTPVSNPLHHNDFQGCNAQYILAASTFVFATLFWEDSYAEVLVSMESISSNHSKRDYEVNFLYSHLG